VKKIRAEFKSGQYDIIIGDNGVELLKQAIPNDATKIGIITEEGLGLENKVDLDAFLTHIKDAEASKNIRELDRLARELIEHEFDRKALLIALGGGAVSDLVGYLAASYMRGIRYINVPTTLTGQVDAAIGGKTAVNLSTGQKNILGAFYQPTAVICDIQFLSSLDETQLANGYGEVAKYCLIGAGDLRGKDLIDIIEACVRFKVDVVSRDEFETTNIRAILNYGHTLAHALEAFARQNGYMISHGKAVGLGLLFAGRLAYSMGRITEDRLKYHYEIVSEFNLNTEINFKIDSATIIKLMRQDKKTAQSLTFILDGPDGLELVRGLNEALVKEELNKFFSL
jgi:5-deoxy-5-amino-3-dehydroquinate synthase